MKRTRTGIAVALSYAPESSAAPTLRAKGVEDTAERILELARRYQIPVVSNAQLARTLSAVPLDQEIPPQLYQAVAVILAELSRPAKDVDKLR